MTLLGSNVMHATNNFNYFIPSALQLNLLIFSGWSLVDRNKFRCVQSVGLVMWNTFIECISDQNLEEKQPINDALLFRNFWMHDNFQIFYLFYDLFSYFWRLASSTVDINQTFTLMFHDNI